ncbi:interactor of HORMAD1 protein 1 isoform X3 [Heterocephalus glaber]|uniref:Coiled-coil domain-containing protein 36 n=2 Tax=Heterocephalus glaber TaxID=10181 RepID=A0A0P6J3N1_HETGA|nr:interactor of HORMAD1 protein 1 isoform X3 [Heterocephalus glaber]XP_012925499.1 interactor of HORMAD1 protein 1 isoform X3 [Heterocephalus glaber]XP_021116574.1 interactor of HORMAD1 protein 1 isoform X3 [Heterocephalus glaber]XP_021116653.1 interactor of HORMAD1 protein 1 isoform X3 [Heterocephalus glaber]
MNFNVWNVKEMLSIPSGSGTTKSSHWNNNQTDYSALSDSQFLFGSQFCPENSETLSAPLDLGAHLRHSKQLQQNSVDSEPSIFTKYQTKPQLFGGETKDRGLFSLPLPVGKSKCLLKQFEEKNKTAKDKCDSESLYNFLSQVRENIQRLQTSVDKSEEHLTSRSQSILDSLETVAKTLQETARVQSDLRFEAIQEKGNAEQAILEMQKKFEARQTEFIEMKSSLKHLEVLVAQQNKDFQQLCEHLGQLHMPDVLEELKRLISAPQVPRHVKDSASQTSPSLAQSLSFIKQSKLTCEEPVAWQIQAAPAAGNCSAGFLRPGEFGVWGKQAKSDSLQEKAALPAVEPCKGNEQVKDKEMQTNCQDLAVTKTSPKNHGSSIPDHKACADRDLVSQGGSQLISLDLNDVTNSIQNVCPEYQAQSIFFCDPCQQLVTEQKGKTVERGRKSKKQQPRKAHRGRVPARKREQTPSKTRAFNPKYQSTLSPVSGPGRPPTGQQELLAQALCLQGPRSSPKSVCPALGRRVKPSKTARAVRGGALQFTTCSSKGNRLLPKESSFQRDHQMSWFSDLNLENSEPAQCKEAGKNLLYHLGFDSSDDDF